MSGTERVGEGRAGRGIKMHIALGAIRAEHVVKFLVGQNHGLLLKLLIF